MSEAGGAPKGRLATIDGLRGIAALAVTLFHLREATHLSFPGWSPPVLDDVFRFGYLGVDIFFVLSGFVIAFGLTGREVTAGYFGRFVLRRSLRLDPPYWTAIVLELLAVSLAARVGFGSGALPDWRTLGLHLLYAQELAGAGSILPIFWTLCFEIQFYVVLVGAVALSRTLRHRTPVATGAVLYTLGLGLFVLSLATRFGLFGVSSMPGLALIRWYQFFLGACTWWAASRRLPVWPVLAGWAAVLIAATTDGVGQALLETAALGTSLVLLIAYRRDRMQAWLSGPWLLYLGTISYSVYLYHSIFGWRTVRLLGQFASPARAPFLNGHSALVIGLVVSIASAAFLYHAVERPSLSFSRRVRL